MQINILSSALIALTFLACTEGSDRSRLLQSTTQSVAIKETSSLKIDQVFGYAKMYSALTLYAEVELDNACSEVMIKRDGNTLEALELHPREKICANHTEVKIVKLLSEHTSGGYEKITVNGKSVDWRDYNGRESTSADMSAVLGKPVQVGVHLTPAPGGSALSVSTTLFKPCNSLVIEPLAWVETPGILVFEGWEPQGNCAEVLTHVKAYAAHVPSAALSKFTVNGENIDCGSDYECLQTPVAE